MFRQLKKNKIRGFTLVEIVVVVIITGVLASLAIPRYLITVEKMRAQEGERVLVSILGAQKRYALENEGAYANNINLLDIELRALENFNPVLVSSGVGGELGRAFRAAPAGNIYFLAVFEDGSITCTATGDDAQICSKMGY